jgi:GTP-binding protein HflX
VVPYDRGDLVAFAHARARVLDTSYEEGGTRMRLLADERVAEKLRSELALL